MKKRVYLLLVLLSLIPLQVLLSLREKSPTFDETPHLFSGYSYLKTGDFRMNPEHPPLSFVLAALPLLALDVKFPKDPDLWARSDVYTMAWKFVFFENDAEKLFFWARFPMIGLGMLLGYLVYRWAQDLYGEKAGLFALLLYVFCPNMLAHLGLINTDLAVTTFIFLSCYFFSKLVAPITPRYFLQTALAFGLALLCKNSAVLLVPGFVLMGLIWILMNPPVEKIENGGSGKEDRKSGLSFILCPQRRLQKGFVLLLLLVCIGAAGYLAVWTAYGFRYNAMKEPVGHFIVPWETVTPKTGLIKEVGLFIREHHLLPEAYTYGLLYTHMSTGKRLGFLAGSQSLEGWWYYFIVVLLIKTPIPLLLLLGLTALTYLGRSQMPDQSRMPDAEYRMPDRKAPTRIQELLVLLPPALYFTFSLQSNLNIGLRHILPIFPFLFVLVSRLVPLAQMEIEGHRLKLAARKLEGSGAQRSIRYPVSVILMGALAVWFIVCSLRIYPDYLSYFNEFIGGPDNGHKYLVDSNLDWGQDLKGLKRYMDTHGIEKINLAYFGTAEPGYYGIKHIQLPGFLNYTGTQVARTVDPRYPIAISVTLLQGIPFDMGSYRNFLDREPIAKIGYSIFVYKSVANPSGN